MIEADAMISRRRLLRHAVPAAAGVLAMGSSALATPPAAGPTIPPELIDRMDAWRNAYLDMAKFDALAQERRPNGTLSHSMMSAPGALTELGERWYDARARERATLDALLAAILTAPRSHS